MGAAMTSGNTNRPPVAAPPAVAAAPGRHSTAVVVGAGLAGAVLGAIAAFAITGLVFTVRVELPPPPYPQLSSTPPVSYPPPPAPTPSASQVPGVVPGPPAPPGLPGP
ncbi:hypothetical protein A5725_21245 [Mycobacterium kubicae]|nr:hypothetical protein A5725_21245 [Mycobacterium kubicae]